MCLVHSCCRISFVCGGKFNSFLFISDTIAHRIMSLWDRFTIFQQLSIFFYLYPPLIYSSSFYLAGNPRHNVLFIYNFYCVSLKDMARIYPSTWVHAQSLRHVQLCEPVDCSPPDSTVHGISVAIMLEWVAISYSKGSSWPCDWTCILCLGRRFLYQCTTWEALKMWTFV